MRRFNANVSQSVLDNYRYKQKMCHNCKFFMQGQCSKKRVVVQCAKKGLKNKE